MKNKEIQSGRSMVEMLGVLAIIGVLSVGGIAGYSMAMKRHALNEIMAKTNLILFDIIANASVNEDFGSSGTMSDYLDHSILVQDLLNTPGIVEVGSNISGASFAIGIDPDRVNPSDICDYIKSVNEFYTSAFYGSCIGCFSGTRISSGTNCQAVSDSNFTIWIAP